MDPFSLAVGTIGLITAFKEVYLLSQSLYQACESAIASNEEREKLRRDLRYELETVQAFGRLFLKNKGGINEAGLDAYWVRNICDIFESLRKSLNDYKKLDDPQYKHFSPYANDQMYDTNLIEFNLDEPIPPAACSKKMTPKFSLFGRAKDNAKAAGNSAKWALYDKKKLQAAVASFQQETEKLRRLLPFAQSAQFSRLDNKIGAVAATIQDIDAKLLGLVPHAKLIELNEADENSHTDVNEKNDCVVITESTGSELSAGTVESKRQGNKAVDSQSVLIELKHYPPSDDAAEMRAPDYDTEANVRRLAALLKISSSGSRELRTLPFQFYVHQPEEERYAFIFGYPLHAEQSQPLSLHDLIKNSASETRFPLATRFQVAQMIAQSIGVFHADGWVHKSVCSQSIVFFKERTKETLMLDSPYLVDFGYSRPEQGRTYARYHQTADSMTLYLHPDRPRMTFTKLHDIYALGVVLLELATWTVAQAHFTNAAGGLDLDVTNINKEEVRRKFLSIAKKSIPYHMGKAYMEAVIHCLDDTYKGQTTNVDFVETFRSEIIEKLSAKRLLE